MRASTLPALLFYALSHAAWAQTVSTPLRIIVPVGTGGTSDVVARIIAEPLAVEIGRAVIVDNKPGATGKIAVDALKQASPGDTLLVAPIAVPVVAPLALRDLGYDPRRDMVPVSQIATFDYAFAVPATSKAQSFPDFVEWAKRNPDAANFGATGAGTVPYFLGTHIARAAHMPLTFVSYKTIATLELDLAGGHLSSAVSATSDLASLHRTGKIRILATTGAARFPLLPDVPTLRELGVAGIEAVGWTAAFASARAPQSMIDAWSNAVVRALSDPVVRAKLEALGVAPTGTSPDRLTAIIASDFAYWQPIVRSAGHGAE